MPFSPCGPRRHHAQGCALTLGDSLLNHGITTAGKALLTRLTQITRIAHFSKKHPKRFAGVVAGVLLMGAGGAFAVASLGPDPADLPASTVVEMGQSLAEGQSVAALTHDMPQFSLFRSDNVRASDTAESLLQRLGVADPTAAAFLRSDTLARQQLLSRTNRLVKAQTTDTHRLVRLTARWAHDESGNFKRLVIERKGDDGPWASRIETAPLQMSSRLASGTIASSLFAATDEARIPDNVAVQIAEIFSGNIDFRRALRKGDRFALVYETLEADGEPLRSGRVLSAEFQNHGKTHQAIWFQAEGASKGGYYLPNGESLQRAYLTSPLAFTRVSSGFEMRFHPILQMWRAHLGTDFAAPSGTPVRTVGDGVVSFAGMQNGFGNVVFVQHRNGHETVYAHLSRIDVRKGQSISQGENVGAVGATGWATGPHLHFEFRVNGKHQDPMIIAQQSEVAAPIARASHSAFERLAGLMRSQLAAAEFIQQASAD